MARARLLKPDFFEDEKLNVLPLGARLLFQALWCLADREGRLEDRPSRVAAFAFPAMPNEKLQASARRDVIAWRNLLVDAGMVLRYEVEGLPYLLVVSFLKHQKPHQNETKSVLPGPLATLVTIGNQRSPMVPRNNTSHAIGDGSDSGVGSDSNSGSGVEDGSAPVRRDIFNLFDSFMGRPSVTEMLRDVLIEAEEEHGLACLKHCFEEAAKSSDGRRSWKYVESIARRHARDGCAPGDNRIAALANGRKSDLYDE